MCCLVAVLGLFGPRLGILIWYIADPLRWQASFDTWIWPLLGSLFLPWTTLMYVVVAPGGVHGFDWLWIGLAVVVDIAFYAGQGREGGRQVGSRR
jgi:hypothetical protein